MSEGIDQTRYVEEMTNWLRLLGIKQLVTVLESDVNDDKRKQAYQISDGKRTTRDIAKLIGVTPTTISDWWKKWILLGLGEYVTASGGHRFKKAFDLESLGIITNQNPTSRSSRHTEQKEEEEHE